MKKSLRMFAVIITTVIWLARANGAETTAPTTPEGKTDLTTVIVSAILGVFGGIGGAFLKSTLGSRAKIDESLRAKRLDVYADLWKKTGLLPKWPKSQGVTYATLASFSQELQTWYFAEGGIFLSEKARKVYGDLQETLNKFANENNTQPLSDPDYESARQGCSKLRTELTRDLMSRRRTFLISQ